MLSTTEISMFYSKSAQLKKKKERKEKSKYTFYYYRTVWDSLFFLSIYTFITYNLVLNSRADTFLAFNIETFLYCVEKLRHAVEKKTFFIRS